MMYEVQGLQLMRFHVKRKQLGGEPKRIQVARRLKNKKKPAGGRRMAVQSSRELKELT